jgi:hypothetical protein
MSAVSSLFSPYHNRTLSCASCKHLPVYVLHFLCPTYFSQYPTFILKDLKYCVRKRVWSVCLWSASMLFVF